MPPIPTSTPTAPETGFLLGYGGWASMTLRSGAGAGSLRGGKASNKIYLSCTGGEYSRSHTAPMLRPLSAPWNTEDRAPIRIGFGVWSYTGSIDFEMDNAAAGVLLDDAFFYRQNFLDFELCDGKAQLKIPGAVWDSATITATPGKLVTGSLSFASCNGYEAEIEPDDATHPNLDFKNLEPYWSYGAEGVEHFSLNFTRDVSPVYLNEHHWCGPTYLRVGNLTVKLDITCWQTWFDHLSIRLGSKKITFNDNSFQATRAYRLGGREESTKTYSLTAVAAKSTGPLFTLSN